MASIMKGLVLVMKLQYFLYRQRIDPCVGVPEEDIVVCNSFEGFWTTWSLWSSCPVTCGTGSISRRRGHTCGLPDQFESVPCNENLGKMIEDNFFAAISDGKKDFRKTLPLNIRNYIWNGNF